ncbi:MAG: hypothetical protein EAZ89_13480 [Bacteroidetes bacterium]|nr:MAG: hypothetical protein EAZ89_13480 [Bacteroidota bacterium]
MIAYDPKDWFTFIFRFHKSDTFRKLLPLLVAIAAYSVLVAYLEIEIWKLADNPHVRNLTLLHNLLGFVLSLLLVFRTNTAYDRWWEGRKAWGSLTNASRNLSMALHAALAPENEADRNFFRQTIPFFAQVLNRHLRAEATRLELDDHALPELASLDHEKHLPNQVAALLHKRIARMLHEGRIQREEFLGILPLLHILTDVCGMCERIKNTPIPYSYSAFIKKFIFFYVMTLPWGFVFSLGYYVSPVVAFVMYVLASLELIAEEIEDPFSGDVNDIPTDKLADNIRRHIAELI